MPLGRSDGHQNTFWFCHECHQDGEPLRLPDPHCPYCNSTFVEQLGPSESLSSLRHWSNGPAHPHTHTHHSRFDDSPPIQGTRQRYEQQLRDAHPDAGSPIPTLLDPLLNMLGIHPAHNQHRPEDEPSRPTFSRHPTPARRPYPDSQPSPPVGRAPRNPSRRFHIDDFLREDQPPRTRVRPPPSSGGRYGFARRASEGASPTRSLNPNRRQESPPPMPGQLPGEMAGGVYTFTFDSRSPTPVFGFQPTHPRPAHDRQASAEDAPEPDRPHAHTDAQPALHGLFSLLQNALGLNGPNAETEQATAEPGERTEPPSGRASPHAHTGPTAAAPGVTLEDGHPLRQFIDLLGTLSRQDGLATGTGFVLNGGAGFGFAAPRNIGDYVTSETAMQEILNQLINVAGNGASASPPPASEAQIKRLRRFEFSQSGDEPVECAICKDAFEQGDECLELPCKHYFHAEDCIGMWLKQNGTCPVCRFSLVTAEQGSEGDAQDGSGPSEGSSMDRHSNDDSGPSGSSSPPLTRPFRRESDSFTAARRHADDDEWEDVGGNGGMELPFDVD